MKNKKIIVVIILMQFLAMPMIAGIVKLFMYIGAKIPNSSDILWINAKGFELSLNEVMTLSIYFMQALITGIVSYYLWRSGEKSNAIAEELKNNEINRDLSNLKENTLIVFYDLKLGLSNLKKLYEGIVLEKKNVMPKRIFLSEEWIKNVAVLKDELKNEDIKKIYDLYSNLLSIKELLTTKDEDDLKYELRKTSEQVFADFYLEYAKKGLKVRDIEAILDIKYQIIFEQLRYIIYAKVDKKSKKDIERINCINTDSGVKWLERTSGNGLNGNIEIYNENGNIRYKGLFENSRLVDGERYEYLDKDENYLKVIYMNTKTKKIKMKVDGEMYLDINCLNGKFGEGYKKIFYDNGKLKYKGYLKNDKYNGEGVEYKVDRTRYEGIFKNGYLKEGMIYNELLEDTSVDYSWYAEQAQIKECEEQAMDENYQKYLEAQQEIEGEKYKIGILVFGDILVENGEYRVVNERKKNKYEEEYSWLS